MRKTAAGPISQSTVVPELTAGIKINAANRPTPAQMRLRGVSHPRTFSNLLPIGTHSPCLLCGEADRLRCCEAPTNQNY